MKILFLLLASAGATATETHGLTSGTTARTTALVRERESFEARIHTQLGQWCNATLPAQQSRQTALQHLLIQAQSSTTPVGPGAAEGTELAQMEAQAATLGSELEGQRLQVQASKSSTKKEMRSRKLDLDDAIRDVDALQRAYDQLGGVKAPANAGVKAAAKLLAQAKSMKQQAEQKVQLLQTHSAAGSGDNLLKLETQYRSSKADIVSSLHQFYTTQRSLDVLTSALEDESGYLADLQSICGAEALVHTRLENHVLPMLRRAPTLAAKEVAANKIAVPAKAIAQAEKPKATLKVAATKPATAELVAKAIAPKPVIAKLHVKQATATVAAPKQVLAHKPTATKPTATKVATKPTAFQQVSTKPTATKAKPAVAHKNLKAKTQKHLSKPKATTATKVKAQPSSAPKHAEAAVAKAVATPHPAKKHVKKAQSKAQAPPAVEIEDSAETDDNAAQPLVAVAPKPTKAMVVAKPVAHRPKKHRKKSHAKAPPASTVGAQDNDDSVDDVAAAPPPPLAMKAKKHKAHKVAKAAHKAAASPPKVVQAKQHKTHKVVHKAAPLPPQVKDPLADDGSLVDGDDDATPAPPPPPVVKAKKHKVHKLVHMVAAPPPKVEDPFADDDDDATSAPPPPPVAKAKKHKVHKVVHKVAPPPPKVEDSSADDDDDATPAPRPPPVPKAKKHKERKVAHKVALKVAPPPPKVEDPFADDDDDATPAPPPPPVSKAKKHKVHKVAHKVAPPPPKVEDLSADDDDDATPAPPPPPVSKAKKHKVHKAARKVALKVAPPPPKVEDPFADDDDDATAAPPPPPVAKAKKHKVHKVAHKVAPPPPKVEDPFADDDDDATAAPPPPPASKAKKHKVHKVAHKVAPPPPKMKDPFADDDDDSTPAAPQPVPAAKAKKHKARKAVKVLHKVAPKVKDPFADDDDDATPAPAVVAHHHAKPLAHEADDDDDASSPPPVSRHAKSHVKKVAKLPPKNEFLDGVYDSAAGNLPTAYAAWKPDDAKSAPAPPPARTAASSANAKNAMMAMLGKDTGDEPVDLAPPTPVKIPAAPVKSAAEVASDDADATFASVPAVTVSAPKKAKKAAADDADPWGFNTPDTKSKPADADPMGAMKAAVTKEKTPEAPADGGDDFFTAPTPKVKAVEAAPSADDTFSAAAAPQVRAPKLPARKGPKSATEKAMEQQLDSDDSIEQGASQLQMPGHSAKAKTNDVVIGNVPRGYGAWSPDDSSNAEAKKKAALAEMSAGFDDDDDPKPTPAPHRRHKRHHHRTPAPAPPPPPKASADGVIYDDDDLPKHHASVMDGLDGGWQALMKKPAHVAPKVDQDVEIMQSLYAKDGGLPTQYKAWSPDDAPKAPAPKRAKPSDDGFGADDGGGAMDLEAAAKAFEKNPDAAFDFMQVGSEARDPIGELIRHAAIVPAFSGGASFLESSAVSIDESRRSVASTVLEEYGEVLKSRSLKQLAKAKLSLVKLTALYQQLRHIDPLGATAPVLLQGKQAKAEHMCKYFQEHMKAAAPMQKAVSFVEAASNELAESVSRRAALLEEIDARTQLQKTMEQDVASLTTLAGLAKQGEDVSALQALSKQLTGAAATSVVTSADFLEGAHEEIQDLLSLSLKKRSAALQAQNKKLAHLQSAVADAEKDLSTKKTRASTSQAAMQAARGKLSGITTSCDTTLNALDHRRHAGHMEAHAIEVALKVLGGQ